MVKIKSMAAPAKIRKMVRFACSTHVQKINVYHPFKKPLQQMIFKKKSKTVEEIHAFLSESYLFSKNYSIFTCR